LISIGLLLFGWFWVAVNFSAPYAAWWNSTLVMFAIFAAGTGVAGSVKWSAVSGALVAMNGLSALLWLLLIAGQLSS
jgi:hypothetical protein